MNANAPDVPPVIVPPTPGLTAALAPRFKFLLAAVVWLSVVLVGTGVTLILPEMFASTARLQVLPEPGQTDGASKALVHDHHFVQTQVGVVCSEAVLGRVVEALELPQVWGKKYYNDQKLKVSECIALLRGRMDVRVMTNSSLMDIRIYSDTALEAATIANEVARAYQKSRTESVQRLLLEVVKELEKQLQLQDQKLDRIKASLASLAEAGEAAPPNSPQKLTYIEKQKAFETELDVRQLLVRRLSAEKLNYQLPRSEQVTVVDSAVPGLKPVRPNLPLNIILSIMLGTMFGVTLAGLVYLFQWRAYRRNIGVYGPAHSPGLRNSLRVIIGVVVGIIAGYNCAMPIDPSALVSFPLALAAGGIGLGFVELANSTPLPPVVSAADGSR